MPLSSDDFVLENSGTVTRPAGSTTVTVSLAGADQTTAGNTVIVVIACPVNITGGPTADWVNDTSHGNVIWVYRHAEIAAGESSWNFTVTSLGADTPFHWYVAEVSNIDPVEPMDASATSTFTSVSDGGTKSSGTTLANAGLNTVLLAIFGVQQSAGTETQSWSGYTNDFEEVVDLAANAANGRQLAIARKFITGTTGTFETTATLATSAASSNAGGMIAAYRAADSPIAAPLSHLQGLENGTHGGINSHTGGTQMTGSFSTSGTGTFGTDYLIQAGSARNSGYGLRVVASGAAAYVLLGSVAGRAWSIGMDVRVVSATGTVVVAGFGTGFLQLLYDATTSKFGVRCGTTGTVSWQSGTTALNTWVWVDIRLKISTTTHHVDWRLETGADTYTDQPAAELAGQSNGAASFVALRCGHTAAQTMTADYDNICLSNFYVAYPLGPHQIRLLTVDPAGTPTVSGTSSNFSVFTANGTLGAWNATNARDAVDEVPPTVSASADGVCQTATAASDYIEFPMAPPTLAADEIIAGVRELAAMWGGTGAGTGTVGIRGWDGTTETTLVAASASYDAGSPTAISATEPRWQTAMWPMAGGWTKTKLDAAALRFGFSTDAAPDMGTDAMYLEYATRKARLDPVFGEAGALPRVEQETNPYTLGIRALRTYTADQALEVTYEVSGTPTTYTAPASSNPHTQVIDAPDYPSVNVTARPV